MQHGLPLTKTDGIAINSIATESECPFGFGRIVDHPTKNGESEDGRCGAHPIGQPSPAWTLGDAHFRGRFASRKYDRADEGAMNGEMFLAYVDQCLLPTLRRNDIVVMDNARPYLVPGLREVIEKARATLRYLPKYSPDLNPIELPYSKFKAMLRKVAERTVPGLYRAIRSFVTQLDAQECANYFRHAGYASI